MTTTTTTLPNGNRLIHSQNSDGYECWQGFDKNNNLSHYKNSNGYEFWQEYDKNNNLIHFKNSKGVESWHHKGVGITKEEFGKIHNIP